MRDLSELELAASKLSLSGEWGSEAISCNQAILEIQPRNVNALNRLARCFLLQRQYDHARENYEVVLEIDAENQIARNGLERMDRVRASIERHRQRLATAGLNYRGVQPAQKNRRRITHCFACKHLLDNDIDVECSACGWILCSCGACGCTYDR